MTKELNLSDIPESDLQAACHDLIQAVAEKLDIDVVRLSVVPMDVVCHPLGRWRLGLIDIGLDGHDAPMNVVQAARWARDCRDVSYPLGVGSAHA